MSSWRRLASDRQRPVHRCAGSNRRDSSGHLLRGPVGRILRTATRHLSGDVAEARTVSRLFAAVSLGLVVAALVPPFSTAAQRYDWVEALQFTVFALLAPFLFVAGAPWSEMGLARPARALAEARRRHPERWRAFGVVAVSLAFDVAWRTPAAVDRLKTGGWALYLEALTLFVASTGLWLECVISPPLAPRSTRPVRITIAAISMWTVWVMAYLVAMSRNDWYHAYRHVAGRGLSLAADQQIASGVMWAVAGCCFIPFIFWQMFRWLRSEEDPDEELRRLVREERRRGPPPTQAAS